MRRPSSPAGSHDEDLKRRISLSAVKRVLALALPYKGILTLSAVLMLIGSSFQLALPILGQKAVDQIAKTKNVSQLDLYSAIAIALILVAAGLGYAQYVISAYAGNKIVKGLREQLFAHLQRLPVTFFDRTRSGDLASHLSNDVSQLQATLTDDISRFFPNLLVLIGGGLIALHMLWQLAVVILGCVVVMLAFFVTTGRKLRKTNRANLDALADAMGGMSEALANIRLVKAFAREPYEDRRASEKLSSVFYLSMRSSILEGLMAVIGMSGGFVMFVICAWFGYRGMLSGAFTAGAIAGFVIVLFVLMQPMSQLAALYTRLQRAVGASERLFSILDEVQESALDREDLPYPSGMGEVRYDNVKFSYVPDTPVLRGLSLTIPAGKVTAIVGPSGAGKTTLAALLYRFYEPQSGQITIDDLPISSIQRHSLRENVGIVPQDPLLFDGTIWENIRYGRLDATDAEIRQAAVDANVDEFVSGFPQEYQTHIGERGITLSGGQRQRVSIARALLKDPRILILDEATSALDNKSESLVREALDRLMEGRTTLVIAHRLSTIRSADQIAVVADGGIAEIGAHADLLKRGGAYADLYELVDA